MPTYEVNWSEIINFTGFTVAANEEEAEENCAGSESMTDVVEMSGDFDNNSIEVSEVK